MLTLFIIICYNTSRKSGHSGCDSTGKVVSRDANPVETAVLCALPSDSRVPPAQCGPA